MRLVQAEILKLVRRRGTMIWCALLTIGSVLIADIVLLSLHAANASAHGPAGGAENLKNLVFLVGGLGNVAAILIGSAAGSQDVSAGVFRDLVVTGRPRGTLFNVRVPGALAVFLPLLAVAFGIAVGGAYLFSGSLPQPTASDVVHFAIYLTAITSVDIVLAIGLAAFVSSRVVVGVLIAWNAIVSHLLISFHILGSARTYIDVAAAQHFLPASADQGDQIAMSSGKALVVLLIWTAVFMAAGRFWTRRRDA
jgi:ABC-type transport system involved in multi-copper enzyme maturation permease subunit